jgi:hypothetical protein
MLRRDPVRFDPVRFILNDGAQANGLFEPSLSVFIRFIRKAPSKLGGSNELKRVHHDKRSRVR